MSDTKVDNGGPAFPCETYGLRNGKETTIPTNGMTLRDWFAGRMFAQIFATQVSAGKACTWEEMAEIAYAAADAMLAARKEKV